jgi:phosphatidylglycerophosphatase A
MNRLAVMVATAGGAGYTPVAPGTAGSVVGVAAYLLTRHWPPLVQVALVAAVTLAGIWASHRAERHFGREDPGEVVIDEVAGQWLTLCLTGVGLSGALLGFIAFRAFDIAKPWPVRRLEDLPGGVGIMADDLMAGVYGHLVVRVAIALLPGVL